MSDVEWRPWSQDPRYRVGSDGTILGVRGGPLKHTVHPKWGYCLIVVRLASGQRICTTRHRIVCETFHGPCPPGKEAAHRNGVPADCAASNLLWKTKRANAADRLPHGTLGRRLTADQVQEIRLAKGVIPKNDLAERYGVTELTIRHVWRGHTWKLLPWPDAA